MCCVKCHEFISLFFLYEEFEKAHYILQELVRVVHVTKGRLHNNII